MSLSFSEDRFRDIGRLFEMIVLRYGSRIAIHTAKKKTTYEHLNQQANRIAHMVRRHSNERHIRVALLFEQGFDAIASILGVLKAGSAFVVLETSNPKKSLQDICQNCSPALILTNDENHSLAEALGRSEIPIINLSQLPADLSTENLKLQIDSTSAAYICYTSGSTGKPKGVCQSQRNLFHFVRVYSKSLNITHKDRLSLLYSIAFSAANMDIFSSLLSGAALYPYDIRKHGLAGLADWLDNNQISILHTVPTVFRHLASMMEDKRILASVRGIDLGGEAVFVSDIQLLKTHYNNNCKMINHLAATEASVIAQYHVDSDLHHNGELLPVGYAAEGVKIKIVGSDGQEAAAGETGEIVIHSPYISTGYWMMPDLNRKTFEDEGSDEKGRKYRSKDLGYMGEDGKLYFLGRSDSRVKIRGYSVDTNEVEAAIRKYTPGIDVAVIARRLEEEKSPQLVAFLTKNKAVRIEFLLEMLAKSLPNYKIPAKFIFIKKLPKHSSGKINRIHLAKLNLHAKHAQREFVDYKNEIERKIAELFSCTLHLDPVGRRDSFFLLGGDSLKATNLHVLVEEAFTSKIPLHILFQEPTVEGMAVNIEKIQQQNVDQTVSYQNILIPLREEGDKLPFYLVHGLDGQAFVSPYFLEKIGQSQPVHAFQASGLEHPSRNTTYLSLEEMATQYIGAMRVVQPKGPYFVGGMCAGGIVALEIAQQLCFMGEKVGPLVLIDPPMEPFRTPMTAAMKFPKKQNIFYVIDFLYTSWKRKKFKIKAIERLKKREKEGRISLNTSDQKALQVAARSAINFRLALSDYRMKPYGGKVLLLASQERLLKKTGDVRNSLIGDVRIFDVGDRHGTIHDIHNERFSESIQKCSEIANEYMNGI